MTEPATTVYVIWYDSSYDGRSGVLLSEGFYVSRSKAKERVDWLNTMSLYPYLIRELDQQDSKSG